jgi:hypothetical protein
MGRSQASHFAVEKHYMHLLWIEPQPNQQSGHVPKYTIPPHVVFEEKESLCMHINMDLWKYVKTESRRWCIDINRWGEDTKDAITIMGRFIILTNREEQKFKPACFSCFFEDYGGDISVELQH